MRLGLPYSHALDLPAGELMDLIAVEQIKYEGFSLRRQESEDDFWTLLDKE